jgi:hypothetical protein
MAGFKASDLPNSEITFAVETYRFCSCYFSNLTELDDEGESVSSFEKLLHVVHFINVCLYISTHLKLF